VRTGDKPKGRELCRSTWPVETLALRVPDRACNVGDIPGGRPVRLRLNVIARYMEVDCTPRFTDCSLWAETGGGRLFRSVSKVD